MSAAPARAHMTIGEVFAEVRSEFPDVTISKIRFLESEGLIEPERTPSGYRKFTHADAERLRYVLCAQRDRYLPLRVIKQQLDAIDEGAEPPVGGSQRGPRALVSADAVSSATVGTGSGGERMSRRELLEEAGLEPAALDQLEESGLVRRRHGASPYDGHALAIATLVSELGAFGLEPRHLRTFKALVDREIGLVEQVVAPLLRQHDAQARARADETAHEMAALSVKLHAALVKAGLSAALGR
ncbi:MAG: transcriptional regulator FtsR [Streptosporangiaceae bacterium]